MGCLNSRQDINDVHPNIFAVDRLNGPTGNPEKAHIKVKETCLEVFCKGSKDPISWDFKYLRQYGVDEAGFFTFESGRRGPEGPQQYLFKCSRAQQLFELVRAGASRERDAGSQVAVGPVINGRRIDPGDGSAPPVPQQRRSPTTPTSPQESAPSYANVEIQAMTSSQPPLLPRMQWMQHNSEQNAVHSETESMLPKEFIPIPISSSTEIATAFQNPSYSAIANDKANDEDLEEDAEDRPEINYLELDHQDQVPVIGRSSGFGLISILPRESNNNQEDIAEHYQGSYAEIDITSTQALTDLRSSNNDLHAASSNPSPMINAQSLLKHDSTLDSIHSALAKV